MQFATLVETGARPERDRRSPDPSRDPGLPGLATGLLSHQRDTARRLVMIPPARHGKVPGLVASSESVEALLIRPDAGSYSGAVIGLFYSARDPTHGALADATAEV